MYLHEQQSVLEFVYTGEVSVARSRLEMFIESAKELKIVGIVDQGDSEFTLEPLHGVPTFLEDPLTSELDKDPVVMPLYAKKEEDSLGLVKYRCMAGKQCIKTFNKLETLKNHVDSKHMVRSFPCDQCKKAFFTRRELVAHKKTTHREPDQECHACLEKFKTTTMLASHYLKTHKEQQCEKCGFKATGKEFYNHKKNCYKLKKTDYEIIKEET